MRHPKDKDYGEWIVSDPPITPVSVDHIQGVQILHDSSGRPDFVEVSFRSADGDPFQTLRMDYVNALALLSMLKAMQLDEGTPFPDDPRGSSPA